MSSEHQRTYTGVIKEGEKKVGVATLRHLADNHYIIKIAYDETRFVELHVDDRWVVYDGENPPTRPTNQRELVKLTRTVRGPLRLLSLNPDGNDSRFLQFTKDLESKLTNPEEFVDFHHQRNK